MADPVHPELPLPAELRGERVALRPYREGDGAASLPALGRHREDLKTWVARVDPHRSVEDSEVYVRRMAGKRQTREALIVGIRTQDGENCGGIGLYRFDWTVPSLELGYFLHRDARGRGYGTEAVRLVTGWRQRGLGARRIWARCDRRNGRSWKLLERCGYLREATLRNACRDPRGELHDTCPYAA